MKQELVLKEKLPEGWKWGVLEDFGEVIMGLSPKGESYNKEKNGIPLLNGAADIKHGKIIPFQYTNNPTRIVTKGDLLLCIRATIGNIIFSDGEYCIGRGVAGIKITSNLLNKYYFKYYLETRIEDLKNLANGGIIKGIKKEDLTLMKIPLPPLPVQKQIVAKLDAQMAQIEIMKKEAEKEKGASEIFSESILKAVFNNPQFKKDKIKNLCEVNPRKPELKYSDDVDTSFIPMEAVNQYKGIVEVPQVKPFGKIKKGYTYFEENDILFAKITPCMQNKKSTIAKNLINGFGFGTTEFHVLRANQKIMPELLFHYVREGSFIEEAKSHFTGAVGQQRVPKDFIEEYEILYPESKEEQLKLLKKIEKSNTEIHEINNLLDQKLSAIDQLPSSLLNEVFGKYEIPEVK
jgi:type I restriction enzyme S subunit